MVRGTLKEMGQDVVTTDAQTEISPYKIGTVRFGERPVSAGPLQFAGANVVWFDLCQTRLHHRYVWKRG